MLLEADTKTPTADQAKALAAIERWYRGPDKRFLLFGFAGTGKSWSVEQALVRLGVRSEDVVFAAPTGKAALVLRENGCLHARTIHSVLYSPHEVDDLEGTRKARAKAKADGRDDWASVKVTKLRFTLNPNNAMRDAPLVVIDECSMIDERTYRDIMASARKVLFLGDPGQLDPVEGKSPLAGCRADAILEEIMRQRADSQIITLSMLAREGHEIPLGDFGEEAAKVRWGDLKDPIDALRGFDQVICGFNKTRRKINAMMVARLYGDQRKDLYPVHIGAKMLCRTNVPELGLVNGTFGTIAGGPREETVLVQEWRTNAATGKRFAEEVSRKVLMVPLEVTDRIGDEDVTRVVEVPADPSVFVNYAKSTLKAQARPGMVQLDYGYCITTHVSQGSGWPFVAFLDDGFDVGGQRNKLIYTAVTRAKKLLVIVELGASK